MFVKKQCITVDNQVADDIIKRNGDILIAVAFDNTVSLTEKDESHWAAMRPNKQCFETLKAWKHLPNCQVYLYTNRDKSGTERAIAWCANCRFEFDGLIGGWRPNDPPFGVETTFTIDSRNLGTPLMHDKNDIYRDHVDWKTINNTITPMLIELSAKIIERKRYNKQHEEKICFY